MPKYTVYMTNTVSTAIDVEADDPEAAIDAAYESDDMPGGITVGAFGSQSVDDGDWQPDSVLDADHNQVWSDRA
jgi:hypothetical protein